MIYLWAYLLLINLVAAALCIDDKGRARRNAWRIPERTLLITCLLGGAPAFWITMQSIRHKTKHLKFTLTVPVMAILWLLLAGWLLMKG